MPLSPRAYSAKQSISLAVLAGLTAAFFACYLPAASGAVTTYTGVYAGGTIAPGDTVVLNNGASVTGNVVANGTLQFNQSGTTLTVSNTISGTGTLSLTNTGTLALRGTVTPQVIALDMTTHVSAGELHLDSVPSALRIGNSGTGMLVIAGGNVKAGNGFDFGYAAGARGTATITSGRVEGGSFRVGVDGAGTLNINGGVAKGSTAFLGYGSANLGTVTVSSGTFDLSDNLYVGAADNLYGTATGTSTLTVNGGSVVSRIGYIASGFFSRGLATVSSGTWSTQSVILGDGGAGELMVNGGAVIGSSSAYLGRNGGGTGLVTVASGRWDHNSLYIYSGTVAITGGTVTSAGTVNLEGGFSNARAASISGGTWTIGSAVLVNGTNTTFTVNGGTVTSKSASINGDDRGGAAIISSGTWDIGAATMTVWGSQRAGTINVTGGSLVSGDVYLRGGDATVSGGTWAMGTYCYVGGDPRTGTFAVTGGNVSSQQLRVGDGYGNGAVTVSSGTVSQQILYVGVSGTQGSGVLAITGGTVTTGSLAYVRSRGVVAVSGGTWAANQLPDGVNGSIVISGSGRVSIGGGTGSVPLSSGTMSFAGGLTTGTLQASAINGDTGAALVLFEQPGTYTMQPVLSGSLAVTQSGSGVTVLTGANTYTGATTISSGTLQVGNGGTTGALGSGPVINNGSLTFNRSDNYGGAIGSNEAQSITGVGSVRLMAGSLTLSGSNAYSGGTVLAGGTLTLGGRFALGGISSPLVMNAGILNTGTFSVSIGAISGSSGSVITTSTFAGLRTLTSVVTTGSSAFAGSIQNNNVGVLALTKRGAGVLTLSGSNSHSGGTTLNAGSLVAGHVSAFGSGIVVINGGALDLASLAINNQITNNGGRIVNAANYIGTQSVAGVVSMTGTVGGTVNVADTGELKGSGVVFSGPVTLASGAQHSPGDSPGTQTFTDGLTYSTGSILNWELISNTTAGAGTNHDFLSITGGSLSIDSGALLNLIFSGSGSTVSWSDSFWNADHSWTIIDAVAAASSTGDFSLGTISSDSLGRTLSAIRPEASFALDQSGNNVVLTFTAVPEPSTYVVALVGVGISGWAVRRRKSQRARTAA